MGLARQSGGYLLTESLTDPSHVPEDAAIDAFVVAIVQLCRAASTERFAPLSVELQRADPASRRSPIADRMNRSLSTLQRQLHDERTGYREIRDDLRSALARAYVRDKELTLSQIAYMLGFSDQSNFSRAFKRWTGESPREFRRRADTRQ